MLHTNFSAVISMLLNGGLSLGAARLDLQSNCEHFGVDYQQDTGQFHGSFSFETLPVSCEPTARREEWELQGDERLEVEVIEMVEVVVWSTILYRE
jgi:hypothetical protein